MSVADRRARFHELHAREGIFVMPNPWDAGSARLLERCGFEALATTSAGYAWLLGKEDHAVTRDELVAHVAELAAAVDVPLSVDSERCFASDAAGVAETVRLLAGAGAAGCSIEDWDQENGRIDDPGHATELVAAAVEAAHEGEAPLVLTARAGTTCTVSTTSTTRSRAWSPSGASGPTASTRRASPIRSRSPPSSRPSMLR
jgi:2-methylisocitrate lyase-like PEP mutase family enzyme